MNIIVEEVSKQISPGREYEYGGMVRILSIQNFGRSCEENTCFAAKNEDMSPLINRFLTSSALKTKFLGYSMIRLKLSEP